MNSKVFDKVSYQTRRRKDVKQLGMVSLLACIKLLVFGIVQHLAEFYSPQDKAQS